eukprot:jgi/Chlat1/2212/Chrsp17S02550
MAAAAAAVGVLALKLLVGGRKDRKSITGSSAQSTAGTSHPAMAPAINGMEAAHATLVRSSSSTSAIVVNGMTEDILNSPLVQLALARLDSHPPSPRTVPASPSSTAHSPSFARSYTSTPTKAETAHMVHAHSNGTPKSPSDLASSKVYDPQAYNRSYSPSVSPAESPRSFPSPDVDFPATAEVDSHRYQPAATGRTARKLTTGARATQSTAQSVIYSGAQDAQAATAPHKRSDNHQASPAGTEPQHENLTPLQQLRKITPLPHEQQPTTVKAQVSSSTAVQPAPSPPAAATQQQQQQLASRAPATATMVPQAAPAPVATAATQQEAVGSQTAPAKAAAAAQQPASLPAEVSMQQPVSPTRELLKHLTVKTGADNTQPHSNTPHQKAAAPAVSPAAAHKSPMRSPTANMEGSAAKSIIYGSGDGPSPTSRRHTRAVSGQYATKESSHPNPSSSPVISSYVENQSTSPPSMRTAKVSPLPVSDSKLSPAPELKQESSHGSQDSPTAWTARGTTDANPAMKGILYGGNLSAKDQPKRHIRNVEGQYATKTSAIFGDPSLNSAPSAPLGESPRASLRNSRNREVAGKIGGR